MINQVHHMQGSQEVDTILRLTSEFFAADGSLPSKVSQKRDGTVPPLVEGVPHPNDAAAAVELLGDVAIVRWAGYVDGEVVTPRLTLVRREGNWHVIPLLLH